MSELDLHALVAQLRPQQYLSRTNDWIRGSLPRSSFRIGSPASERPGPALDRTDRDIQAELRAYERQYRTAVKAITAMLHYEHVALDEKPGDRDLGGWPCVNYGKRIYGRHCMTDRHDHPSAECAACRKAKSRASVDTPVPGTNTR